MNTADRLQGYYHFDHNILGAVEDAANYQNGFKFAELADQYKLGDGPAKVVIDNQTAALEVIHIKPTYDYDHRLVRIIQAPMGTPADASMAMRAMRLFASSPTVPVMVVGSPSAIGNKSNLLSRESRQVVASGDLRPAVRPVLRYLLHLGIERADIIGYSYGADAGAAMALAAHEFDVTAERAVLMEPAGAETRNLRTLLRDFQASGSKLNAYVTDTGSQPLFEARGAGAGRLASTVGLTRWAGGITRPTNIAIAKAMGRGQFGETLDMALRTHPNLKAAVLWGSESEITKTSAVQDMLRTLRQKHPLRIGSILINGMHHAGGDDIDLHAAMALQGLRSL